MAIQIIVHKHAEMMEGHREACKRAFGSRYDTNVAPLRGLLREHAKKRKMSITEAAIEFQQILISPNFKSPKLAKSKKLRAAVFAAAVDVLEGVE